MKFSHKTRVVISSLKETYIKSVMMSVLGLSLIGLSGCNYVITLGYLIGGPPSIQPEYDRETGKSLSDKDVVVAVVCDAGDNVKFAFSAVDLEIAKYVSYRLTENKVKVINPDYVSDWLDQNDEWTEPTEIGVALNATHIVYIDLSDFSLYEKQSTTLFRGRAEAIVSVYEIDEDDEGEKIFSQELTSMYPLAVPKETSEESYPTFKRKYLARLSSEIGRNFYQHYNGDDIVDAM